MGIDKVKAYTLHYFDWSPINISLQEHGGFQKTYYPNSGALASLKYFTFYGTPGYKPE